MAIKRLSNEYNWNIASRNNVSIRKTTVNVLKMFKDKYLLEIKKGWKWIWYKVYQKKYTFYGKAVPFTENTQ